MATTVNLKPDAWVHVACAAGRLVCGWQACPAVPNSGIVDTCMSAVLSTLIMQSLGGWPCFSCSVYLQSQAVAEAQQADGATSTKKLWGGRFTGATDPLMEKFNESLPFDKRMWHEDTQVHFQSCYTDVSFKIRTST